MQPIEEWWFGNPPWTGEAIPLFSLSPFQSRIIPDSFVYEKPNNWCIEWMRFNRTLVQKVTYSKWLQVQIFVHLLPIVNSAEISLLMTKSVATSVSRERDLKCRYIENNAVANISCFGCCSIILLKGMLLFWWRRYLDFYSPFLNW